MIRQLEQIPYIKDLVKRLRREKSLREACGYRDKTPTEARPPQTVTLYSLKDGIDGGDFQISRAIHSLTPDLGYVCTLYLMAALRSNGTYEPGVSPTVSDFGMSLAMWRRIQTESGLNSLRNVWI